MKDARQPVIDDESRGEVQLSAEEEAMLNEAIAEAERGEGSPWEEVRERVFGKASRDRCLR
jgi:predicted transcriptional regulator